MSHMMPVGFYRSANGRSPVRDALDKLGDADAGKVRAGVDAARLLWPRVDGKLIKKVENGLWEVRVRIMAGGARVMFTVVGGQMVLLHAFVKKTPKTSPKDLSAARTRRDNVFAGA